MLVPSYKCTLRGQEFALQCDMEALGLAEVITGKNFVDPANWAELDVRSLTGLFFACASRTDAKLSLGDIRRYGPGEMCPMVDALRGAWKAATDVPPEDTDRPTNGSEQKVSAESAQ